MKRKRENGHWDETFVREVVAYARKHSNIAAIRKFGVASATFYGWLRRPEYRKEK